MEKQPTKRKRNDEAAREEQREAILHAAEQLLREEGAAALTMRRIAERVGYTTTVLYLHFANKSELCQALYLRGFQVMGQAMRNSASPDPVEQLYAVTRGYVRFVREHPALYGLMFLGSVTDFVPTPQNDQSQQVANVVRTLLQIGVDHGLFRDDLDVDEAARVLWATVHGLMALEQNRLFGYAEETEAAEKVERLPELAVEMALRGLLKRGEGR